MRSIAKEHKRKALAQVAEQQAKAEAENQITAPTFTDYAGLDFKAVQAQFDRHCQMVSALPDIEQKVTLKKQLLPDYIVFLNRYIESGQHYPNPVLSRIIFWCLDVNDIDTAFTLASHAIAQQQRSPENFKRDLPTAFVEEIAEWAERQFKAKASAEPYLTDACTQCLNDQWLVPQIIVLNKLYKIKALFAERDNDWPVAVTFFEHCVTINPEKHGVKIKLEKAQKKLMQEKTPHE